MELPSHKSLYLDVLQFSIVSRKFCHVNMCGCFSVWVSVLEDSMCTCATKKTKNLIPETTSLKGVDRFFFQNVFALHWNSLRQGFTPGCEGISAPATHPAWHPSGLPPATSNWNNPASSCSTDQLKWFGCAKGKLLSSSSHSPRLKSSLE